jgi:PPOX class probable F420-dependent enzyme
MATTLEGPAKALIEDKNHAVLSVPRQDGTVQSVVVWAHTDGNGNVTVNSAEGRGWPANLRRAGTATLTAMSGPWEWVAVTARLEGDTHEGADEHIDALAKKYLDADTYPFRQDGEQRIKFTLRPERVVYTDQS